MHRLGMLLTVALFALLTAAPLIGQAQDATPTGGRDVPDPSECTVPPGSPDEVMALFRELAATPIAATVSADNPALFVLPDGQPADDATVAAIVTATREIIACTNLYGFLGLVAVSTDRHIRDILSFDVANGTTEEIAMEYLAATPEPRSPDEMVAFAEVRDVIVLDDGRIGAIVTGDEPGTPSAPLYFIFVNENGSYLLDEEFEGFAEGTPTP